jgi:hypothetical protein
MENAIYNKELEIFWWIKRLRIMTSLPRQGLQPAIIVISHIYQVIMNTKKLTSRAV